MAPASARLVVAPRHVAMLQRSTPPRRDGSQVNCRSEVSLAQTEVRWSSDPPCQAGTEDADVEEVVGEAVKAAEEVEAAAPSGRVDRTSEIVRTFLS